MFRWQQPAGFFVGLLLVAGLPWADSSNTAKSSYIGPLKRGTDAPVLQEPRVQEHYGFLRNYKEVPFKEFSPSNGVPVPRYKNLDDATFKQLIRDGSPFLVEDCTRDFEDPSFPEKKPIDQLTCKDFSKKWPTGNMRAEYTPGQYHIYLKDPTWYTEISPQRFHEEHMAGKTKIAGPYIWHVKDEEPLKTKRQVQRHWRTPYFLKPSIANTMEANESFEFWFSLAGGGTFTHADAYCESTISMQFAGRKRWRIQAFPEIRHYFNASAFGDSEIYQERKHVAWTPETEFVVEPGQCFIFPTGYLHETFVDPADNDQGCYTASTFQFNHPRQVNLYRNYLSRFAMSHYGMSEPCLGTMASYATLMTMKTLPPDEESTRKEAERLIGVIDKDGDGRLSKEDLYKHFCTSKKDRAKLMNAAGFQYSWWKLLNSEARKDLTEESMQVWSEDTRQYHDLDKDGVITVEELSYNLFHWSLVQTRLQNKQAKSKKKISPKLFKTLLEEEKQILAKHYCKDPNACPELDELARYGESCMKKKGKMQSALRNIFSMLESENEGDNEVLEVRDRESGAARKAAVKELRAEL